MANFTYDDIVRVRSNAPAELRPGAKAWIIAVFEKQEDRPGKYFDKFPTGPVYTIEYEDGAANDIHESFLVAERG